MADINIKHDLAKLEAKLNKHQKVLIKKAAPQAINKTLKAVASHSAKSIAGTTGYKNKDVKARIRTWKASATRLSAGLDATKGKAENLIKFIRAAQANPLTFRKRTKKGFKYAGVKAKAWGKLREYEGTFIAKTASGDAKVFKRTSASRSKITQVSGPSIRREFIDEQLTQSMTVMSRQRFRKELTAAINNQIRRQK